MDELVEAQRFRALELSLAIFCAATRFVVLVLPLSGMQDLPAGRHKAAGNSPQERHCEREVIRGFGVFRSRL